MYKIVSYATSANIGPGFDSLGICLSLPNTFFFSEFYDGVIINHNTDTIRNKDNLIVQSFFRTVEILGYNANGLRLETQSSIPQTRGLGSSASCITAGVTAAMLMYGEAPQKSDIYQISAQIEGHPDNVCPNIFGGLTLAYQHNDEYKCIHYTVDPKYYFIALVPDTPLSTQKAREALPDNYSREDAVFNLRHVSMLTSALQVGDDGLLKEALDDRLHQPYRIPLINDYAKMNELCEKSGAVGSYISGSGPTVMAIASDETVIKKITSAILEQNMPFKAIKLYINEEGLEIFKGNSR